jgi:hypothetical protein
MGTEGIISREEARSWLVREGLFDEESLLVMDDQGRADDTEMAKARYRIDLGPRVRLYKGGRMVRMERPGRLWPLPAMLKTVAANYRAGAIDAQGVADFIAGAE